MFGRTRYDQRRDANRGYRAPVSRLKINQFKLVSSIKGVTFLARYVMYRVIVYGNPHKNRLYTQVSNRVPNGPGPKTLSSMPPRKQLAMF